MLKTVHVLAVAFVVGLPGIAFADHSERHMHVYKDPNCGCCAAWAEIARKHGLDVTVEERSDMAAFKKSLGIPEAVRSCHTATIGGYVVEGHVPMDVVDRLVKEKPPVAGVAVPGMPMGSPGMGDDPKARFDVLTFGKDGRETEVYEAVGTE